MGFKHKTCTEKNCLACGGIPPTLSKKVIRNLGETFCKIDPAELSDSKLSWTLDNGTVVGSSSSDAGKQRKKTKKNPNEDKDKKKLKKF